MNVQAADPLLEHGPRDVFSTGDEDRCLWLQSNMMSGEDVSVKPASDDR